MAVGSGVGASFGVKAEGGYGTRSAPDRFFRTKGAAIQRVAERPQGEGIQAGALGPLAAHNVETTQAATVEVPLDVTLKDFGLLFSHLMGSIGSAVQGAGPAYLHTATLADPIGKSLTCQVGAPYRGGTVQCQEAIGAKITKAEFSAGVADLLSCTLSMDARKYDDSQTLAAVSYTTASAPFPGSWMKLKLGTSFGAEATVTGVRSVSASIERAMDTEDYTAGQNGLKSEPVLNGDTTISGTVSADWLAKATFQDRAVNNTLTYLVWEFVGPTPINATFYPTFRLTVPGVYFASAAQGAGDGRAELKNDWAWSWAYDGTNLPKIEYMTTDTTP